MAPFDLTEYTDTELEELLREVFNETSRRQKIAQGPAQVDQAIKDYQAALGRVDGDEWVQPGSAVDAYPEGATVTHQGATWTSTVAANVWEPGVAGWREAAAQDGAPAAWAQPSGAADAYKTGDQVTFDGEVYQSVVDGNVWDPATYPGGWKKVV